MANLGSITKQYTELNQQWNGGKPKDKAKMLSLLNQMKVSLTALSFLPTEEADTKELVVARDTLEVGVQFSVLMEDIPMFERYMAQLQTYYYDYTSLPESSFKCQLLGLNLLCLLSQNRVAEFHTELERLTQKELESIYIRHPLNLEQYIMEGSYNKVISLKGSVPAESYNFFFEILLKTVRNEIASCLEKAYKEISCADAAKMLSVTQAELSSLAQERGWDQRSGSIVFGGQRSEQAGSKAGQEAEVRVPSLELAKMAISYAREMEQIV